MQATSAISSIRSKPKTVYVVVSLITLVIHGGAWAALQSTDAKSLLGNLSIVRFLQSRAIDIFLVLLASTSTYTVFGLSVPNGLSSNLCRPDDSVSRRGVLPSNFFPS